MSGAFRSVSRVPVRVRVRGFVPELRDPGALAIARFCPGEAGLTESAVIFIPPHPPSRIPRLTGAPASPFLP